MYAITLLNRQTRREALLSEESFTPLQRGETLGDQVCASLRTALRRGMLRPGERLTTREIAGTLGVSLTPAREALNRLVAEGVLEQGPNRTVVVPSLTRARYAELCLIRLELEGLAARHACARLHAAAPLRRLEKLYAEHEQAFRGKDAKRSLQLNEDFHFTIYAAAGLPALLQILETLWLKVGPSMNLLFPRSFAEEWQGGRNHRAMLDAIRAGDAEGLAAAVRQDLEDGRVRLEQVLS